MVFTIFRVGKITCFLKSFQLTALNALNINQNSNSWVTSYLVHQCQLEKSRFKNDDLI